MRLPKLTYPVEQPYRLKWITEIFYAGSFVLIVLLAILNLALVGYDQVTVLEPNPNITDLDQWWAPSSLPKDLRFRTIPGKCQEADLPINAPLRTTSSLPLFTYMITNNVKKFNPLQQDVHDGDQSVTPYKANPLDICHVQNMTLLMEIKIVSFTITTNLLCDPTGEPPRARRFKTTFTHTSAQGYRPDSILEYMEYMAQPNESDSSVYNQLSRQGPKVNSYNNALGVVDALATDLVRAMLMRKTTFNITQKRYTPELGTLVWDSQPDSRSPTDGSRILEVSTFRNGYWTNGKYLRDVNTTIVNLLVAVRDAIHLDVGNFVHPNIYTDKTLFNNMIRMDPYYPQLVGWMYQHVRKDVEQFSTISSWGWGSTNHLNISWAEALTTTNSAVNNITLPIKVPNPPPPSVIDVMYLCPRYVPKSWGSLVVSVFTGTFTMFASIYGIFRWLAPLLDRKRRGPSVLEKYMGDVPLGAGYGKIFVPPASPSSIFDSPHPTRELEEGRGWLLSEYKQRKE